MFVEGDSYWDVVIRIDTSEVLRSFKVRPEGTLWGADFEEIVKSASR
jgi:hypothetical protein